MRIALLTLATLLACAATSANANVSCDDLSPGNLKWEQRMGDVAVQSGLGSAFGLQHRRAILFYCRHADEMVDQLVQQGGITASDLARIKKVVDRLSPEQLATKRRDDLLGKSAPGFESMDRAVDIAFYVWADQWVVDKYIPGTSHGAQQRPQQGNFVSLGNFKFDRAGTPVDAQFAAMLRKVGNDYEVVQLCYNDMGNKDCVDGPTLVERAIMMKILVVGSVLSPKRSATDIAAEKHYNDCIELHIPSGQSGCP